MIENASDSDMGSYECMAKSPAGEVKSRSVHMKPTIISTNITKGKNKNKYLIDKRIQFKYNPPSGSQTQVYRHT